MVSTPKPGLIPNVSIPLPADVTRKRLGRRRFGPVGMSVGDGYVVGLRRSLARSEIWIQIEVPIDVILSVALNRGVHRETSGIANAPVLRQTSTECGSAELRPLNTNSPVARSCETRGSCTNVPPCPSLGELRTSPRYSCQRAVICAVCRLFRCCQFGLPVNDAFVVPCTKAMSSRSRKSLGIQSGDCPGKPH